MDNRVGPRSLRREGCEFGPYGLSLRGFADHQSLQSNYDALTCERNQELAPRIFHRCEVQWFSGSDRNELPGLCGANAFMLQLRRSAQVSPSLNRRDRRGAARQRQHRANLSQIRLR